MDELRGVQVFQYFAELIRDEADVGSSEYVLSA
jgi:hypothetical protein